MLLIKNFTKFKINEKFLHRVAKEAVKNIQTLKNKTDWEVDLAIVGEKRMRTLNRVWRGKDKVTDVLSFGNQKPKTKNQKFKFVIPADDIVHLGQIFICYPVAARQAREDGHSLDKEMAVLLIHGILHLAGYDHEKTAQEARKMFELQEKIIGNLRNKKSRV